jgi:hypothetical protein
VQAATPVLPKWKAFNVAALLKLGPDLPNGRMVGASLRRDLPIALARIRLEQFGHDLPQVRPVVHVLLLVVCCVLSIAKSVGWSRSERWSSR